MLSSSSMSSCTVDKILLLDPQDAMCVVVGGVAREAEPEEDSAGITMTGFVHDGASGK